MYTNCALEATYAYEDGFALKANYSSMFLLTRQRGDGSCAYAR